MKNTQTRFSSRLVMVASMAAIVLLGCCQWLRAEQPSQPSKEEILNASPGSYDYLRLNKYPVRPSPLVERFDIKGKTTSVDNYSRRTVTWWPRKWVDYIPENEIPKAAIKRTWTFRSQPGADPLLLDSVYRTLDSETIGDGTMEAHFIGFRAIGNLLGDKNEINMLAEGEGYAAPMLLRLADGRLRLFTRGMFTDEDQKEMMKLYDTQMKGLHASSVKLERAFPPNVNLTKNKKGEPPYRPAAEVMYKPGRMYLESDNFVVVSGSQNTPGKPGVWVDVNNKEGSARFRKGTFRCFEDFWGLYEYAGHFMYGWNREKPYKYWVMVPGTYYDGTFTMPGNYSGGVGGCGIRNAGGGPNSTAFYHEWGHGARNAYTFGDGEAFADAFQVLTDPVQSSKMGHQVTRPWMNFFHGHYPSSGAYYTIGEDPNWGFMSMATVGSLTDNDGETPMQAYARLGQERGIWKDAVAEYGDLMATICSRWAEFDTQSELQIKKNYVAPSRSYLTAIDREKGLYRCPAARAPHAYGVHISRLVPEKGAKTLTVDFQGIFDKDTFSDWRACIVAVDQNGVCRYSPLWNKGDMSMEVKPGDRRYWLSVTATPFKMPGMTGKGPFSRGNHEMYEGSNSYRYPFEVRLINCTAGSPHTNIADNRNFQLTWPSDKRAGGGVAAIKGDVDGASCDWPVLPDHPDYRKTIDNLLALKKRLPEAHKATDKMIRERWVSDPYGWLNQFVMAYPAVQNYRANYLLENSLGARHKNGGGWVSRNAHVDETAYVGPQAMVLDGAQVLDHASVEDFAIVTGPQVTIKDHAKVFGKAIVAGTVDVSGFARVWMNIFNREARLEYNTDELPGRPLYSIDVKGSSGRPVRTGPELRTKYESIPNFLQANYNMLRDETVLMEDMYVSHNQVGQDYWVLKVFYDGQLFGQPTFFMEEDTDREGFSFDGNRQYAELEPTVLDLGEATVDMAVRFKGKAGVLLDAGHDEDNRFVLSVDPSGKPTLAVTVNGNTTEATGTKPLVTDQWVDVRLEMSGNVSQVFVDNALSLKLAKAFRPSDVVPNGATRRNFLAIDRAKQHALAVDVDYVHVYYKVFKDFANEALEPPVHCPRRIPNVDWIEAKIDAYNERGRKQYDDRAERGLFPAEKELGGHTFDDIKQIAKKINDRHDAVKKQMEASEEVVALRKQIDDWKLQLKTETEAHTTAFQVLDSTKTLEEQRKENGLKRKELQTQRKAVPEVAVAQKAYAELRTHYSEMNRTVDDAIRKSPKYIKLHVAWSELSRKFRDTDKGTPDYTKWNKKRDKAHRRREAYFRGQKEAELALKEAGQAQDKARIHADEVAKAHPLTKKINAIPRIDIRRERQDYVKKQTAELAKKIEDAKPVLKEATARAIASVNPEEYHNGIGDGGVKYYRRNVFRRSTGFIPSILYDDSVVAAEIQNPEHWTKKANWWTENSSPAGLEGQTYENTTQTAKDWMERMMPYRYGPDKGKPMQNQQAVISHAGSLPDVPTAEEPRAKVSPEELEKRVRDVLAMDMGDVPLVPGKGKRSYDPPAVKSDPVEKLKKLDAEKWVVPTAKLSMVKIPAGQFVMGAPKDEVGRADNEVQHEVAISRPFYMGIVAVTQEQYIQMMIPDYVQYGYKKGAWGYSITEIHQGGPHYTAGRMLADTDVNPMDSVSWAKAMAFCKKLTAAEAKAGRLPEGYVYRLPTEAEWEYACRAGTKGAFNVEGEELKVFATVRPRMWIGQPERAGWRKPNAWGLHDMHGNMYEWCLDAYAPYPSTGSPQVDPLRTSDEPDCRRVARGGSFRSGTSEDIAERNRYIRSASRNHFVADGVCPIVGFRAVLAPEIKR